MHKKIGMVLVGLVALAVVAALVMNMSAKKKSMVVDSSQPQSVSETAAGEAISGSDSEAVPAHEESGKDVSTLLSEIESATDGDASALDEEVSDETESVREGQLVIQEMGQSYDETSY